MKNIKNKINEILNNYEIERKKKTFIPFEKIPPILRDGLISAEDRRFYIHPGIDVIGIVRAFRTNLKQGKIVEGASTITQQLVRQLVLTKEKTYRRKLHEVVIALLLERHLSKEQILEFYLNTCFYGVHGLTAASHEVFQKEPQELTISEQAFLAALIARPLVSASTQASFMRTFQRQQWILRTLAKRGRISQEDCTTATREAIRPYGRLAGGELAA